MVLGIQDLPLEVEGTLAIAIFDGRQVGQESTEEVRMRELAADIVQSTSRQQAKAFSILGTLLRFRASRAKRRLPAHAE